MMKQWALSIAFGISIPATAFAQPNEWTDFMAGKRNTYNTSGNPKSRGIELSFDYPISWRGAEGKRPNTLYQVTSDNGRGLDVCNLVIKEIPLPANYVVSPAEAASLFEPSGLRSFVPHDANFIAGDQTTIEGQPAGWVNFTQEVNRAGIALRLISLNYTIYYDKKLIAFGCMVGDGAENPPDRLQKRYKEYSSLFQQMANSIVIQSKWKRATINPSNAGPVQPQH